jgi:hypothetical protein
VGAPSPLLVGWWPLRTSWCTPEPGSSEPHSVVQNGWGAILYYRMEVVGMAGRPRGASARTEVLQVRLTKAGMAALDQMRGEATRADFTRDLLAAAARSRR